MSYIVFFIISTKIGSTKIGRRENKLIRKMLEKFIFTFFLLFKIYNVLKSSRCSLLFHIKLLPKLEELLTASNWFFYFKSTWRPLFEKKFSPFHSKFLDDFLLFHSQFLSRSDRSEEKETYWLNKRIERKARQSK